MKNVSKEILQYYFIYLFLIGLMGFVDLLVWVQTVAQYEMRQNHCIQSEQTR